MVGATGLLDTNTLDTNTPIEHIIRTYFSGYEKKDWNTTNSVLADNFTFTSPNGDDHIPKSAFKPRCFDSQLDSIQKFDIEAVFSQGNEAFVKYLCHTTKNTAFRNVEFHRIENGKIASIECYFGGPAGYPAAAAAKS